MTTEHPERVLEIYVNKAWHQVSLWIFRSWAGPRRIDGVDYDGTVFYLGSDRAVQSSS